jgi:hypothetical protein
VLSNALAFRIAMGLVFVAQYMYGGRYGGGNIFLLVMAGVFLVSGLVGFLQLQQSKKRF